MDDRKEQAYIQRIKDLQDELAQRDSLIEQLTERLGQLEESERILIDRENFNLATEEVNTLLSDLRKEKAEI